MVMTAHPHPFYELGTSLGTSYMLTSQVFQLVACGTQLGMIWSYITVT